MNWLVFARVLVIGLLMIVSAYGIVELGDYLQARYNANIAAAGACVPFAVFVAALCGWQSSRRG